MFDVLLKGSIILGVKEDVNFSDLRIIFSSVFDDVGFVGLYEDLLRINLMNIWDLG